MNKTYSPNLEKVIVSGTAFSCASAAFVFALFILIPLTAKLHAPEFIQQISLLSALFLFPILAAFWGLSIGMRCIRSNLAACRS